MSFTEKQQWVLLVTILGSYAFYLQMVFGAVEPGVPITEDSYLWPLIWAVVATIVIAIVGSILIGIASGLNKEEDFESDERDTDFDRRGEVIGYLVFSIAMLNVLGLAIAEADHFWIGNSIYLSATVASVVSTGVKLFFYRRGY